MAKLPRPVFPQPPNAVEALHDIAFSLATGSRVVEPPEVTAAIDGHRSEVLAEAIEILRAMPIPVEAGDHWHWFDFARNRAVDRLLTAQTEEA